MVSRHPKNKLKEKVHAINAKAEYTEEEDLVVALDAAEDRPVVASPHIWLKLVNECLHLALAGGHDLRLCVDPVKFPHVQVIARPGSQHNTKHIASKNIEKQLIKG